MVDDLKMFPIQPNTNTHVAVVDLASHLEGGCAYPRKFSQGVRHSKKGSEVN